MKGLRVLFLGGVYVLQIGRGWGEGLGECPWDIIDVLIS